MKKIVLSVVAAALCATPALAADVAVVRKAAVVPAPVSMWDWAFGGATMNDYNFRGISQSNRGPSATVYSETRLNLNPNFQFYVGTQYWAVTLPTAPSAEVDLYGGLRATFGPLALDFGYIYYWYPRERQLFYANAGATSVSPTNFGFGAFTKDDTDFWEVYGKATYEVSKDMFWLGAYVYYSPNWLNTGAPGTYAGGTAKFSLPNFNAPIFGQVGWYVSGEAARYWIGTTDAFFGNIDLPDYTYWNAGVAFTWKVATLDLRYHDTTLNQTQCFLLSGDPGGVATARSNWCSTAFIATLKFDLTLANLK
jgi:uncharacterized protein (TIGR02001 family)